ncbi:hypothetical protein FIBSPDRAFT_871783 [Athelia psychrophila]|uniref:Uncharacterized protein n=1 Tax=Athelia psychrophila TaxID=1759441 RepID=A0A166A5B6_9AGAM|nr:hypothetical protein FIBSPDRAFT_871783 [Fibularhizoctonia sp. CBS 109695]
MSAEIRLLEIYQYTLGVSTLVLGWGMRRLRYPWVAVVPAAIVGLGFIGRLFAKQTRLMALKERIEMTRQMEAQQAALGQ